MENLNALKAPEPNIKNNQNNNEIEPKRKTYRPNVGVVSVPSISRTPLTDVVELEKKENPHIVYKLNNNKKTSKFQNFSSIAIVLLSILAFFDLKHGKKVSK